MWAGMQYPKKKLSSALVILSSLAGSLTGVCPSVHTSGNGTCRQWITMMAYLQCLPIRFNSKTEGNHHIEALQY